MGLPQLKQHQADGKKVDSAPENWDLALAADLLVGKMTVASDYLDVVKCLHGRYLDVYSHPARDQGDG
jgi:hypothetical protein